MALFVVDYRNYRCNGGVCIAMATGYQANATFHGLYVQGHEPSFCFVDFDTSFWRNYYDK